MENKAHSRTLKAPIYTSCKVSRWEMAQPFPHQLQAPINTSFQVACHTFEINFISADALNTTESSCFLQQIYGEIHPYYFFECSQREMTTIQGCFFFYGS